MLRFRRNPEFVRHLRSQLRPTRAITVAAVVLILCGLVWMCCWGARRAELAAAQQAAQQFGGRWIATADRMQANLAKDAFLAVFKWLLGIQGVVLTFWSMAACAQSVLGERDRKTWDFQRTTRLAPAEIVIGKLLGEPVLAYFVMLCSLPLALIAGVMSGTSVTTLFSVYLVLIANALFLGLGGLWLSTMLESRSRGLFVIGALGLLAFSGLSIPLGRTHFPGLAAFSPYMEIGSKFGGFDWPPLALPTLFGRSVSWTAMSLLLYVTFGAWLGLLLVRNIKRDYADIRPFSRWQALGFAAFLNFLIYALFRPSAGINEAVVTSRDLANWVAVMNGVILFVVGLATLTPRERLKVWWRWRATGHAGLFSEEGLPWPWIALSAGGAYVLMIWGLMAWRHALSFDAESLKTASIMMLAISIFVIRDVLFVQWCMLTRMRQPVVKGLLYLCLYYTAVLIAGTVFFRYSSNAGERVLTLLTPGAVFNEKFVGLHFSGTVYLGLALQVGLIAVILMAISNRLSRPAMAPALAAA